MTGSTSYEVIAGYMPSRVRAAMLKLGNIQRDKLTEVRIRSGRPVAMVSPDRIRYLSDTGELSFRPTESSIRTTPAELTAAVGSLCRYSVHSYSKELREGFFVVEKGVRVGVAGTVSSSGEHTLRDISSLNFRIPRSVTGCAESIVNSIGTGNGVLICGGVNSGKTTVLRDLCRIIGDRHKTVLIDERNEISATVGGLPTNDIGLNTDVIVGSARSDGVVSAIRTLSPDIIICDEISTESDCEAILLGHGCGVSFAATVHAVSFDDLRRRQAAARLIEHGVFGYAVQLAGAEKPSHIAAIRRLRDDS